MNQQIGTTPQQFHRTIIIPGEEEFESCADIMKKQACHDIATNVLQSVLDSGEPFVISMKKEERPTYPEGSKKVDFILTINQVQKQQVTIFTPPAFKKIEERQDTLKDFFKILWYNIKGYCKGIQRRYGNFIYMVKWQILWVNKRRFLRFCRKVKASIVGRYIICKLWLKKYVSSCIIFIRGLFQRKEKND